MEVQGFDDSTQHPQGAVELEWDEGEKVIRFVAHVVLGNSGMLLSRSDLEALGATIDLLRNEQMHLENPRTTLELSATPAGHFEVDLLNLTRDAAGVDSLDKSPGSTVQVSTMDGSTSPFFERWTLSGMTARQQQVHHEASWTSGTCSTRQARHAHPEPRAHLEIRSRMCTYEGDRLYVDLLLCDCGLEHGKNWVKTVLWDKPAFLAKNPLAGALLPADRARSFKSPCI